jgi:hypothetical protein
LEKDKNRYDLKDRFNLLDTAINVAIELDKLVTNELEDIGRMAMDGSIKSSFKRGKLKEDIDKYTSKLLFRMGITASGAKVKSRFDFKTQNTMQAQWQLLKSILESGEETLFGKEHGFEDIHSIEDYQSHVPVQNYDSLKKYIDLHTQGIQDILVKGKPLLYATTSGTTGEPKYIPITKEASEDSHRDVVRLWTYQLFKDHPEAFAGKILSIVSPAEEGKVVDGTPFGSTSGQLAKSIGNIAKGIYALPYEIFEIEDYEARYYCILLLGISQDISMIGTANPSTISLLAKKGNELKENLIRDIRNGYLSDDVNVDDKARYIIDTLLNPNPKLANILERKYKRDREGKLRPIHYWPKLSLITCWTGGNSSIFMKQVSQWYPKCRVRDLGYLASEMRGSVPLWDETNAGALTIHENFFEFVEISDIDSESPRYLNCEEIQVGKRYYIFITTKAGLYRYNINDIVEVMGHYNTTPCITFVQKGRGVTNITGEKLYEQQLQKAVEEAEKEEDVKVKFFIGLAKADESEYDLYTEFVAENTCSVDSAKLKLFIDSVERHLQKINIEYKAKRKSLRLNAITVKKIESGSFESFKAMRVSQGIRETQFKSTPLTQDSELTKNFNVTDSAQAEQVGQYTLQ